jgi:hypothetical protein
VRLGDPVLLPLRVRAVPSWLRGREAQEEACDMIDQKRLDEIKARCKAAKPGPWARYEAVKSSPPLWCVSGAPGSAPDGEGATVLLDVAFRHPAGKAKAVASFVAASRTDVPDLVAEVERLRAALSELASFKCGHKPFNDGSCSPACGVCEMADDAKKALGGVS